MAIGLSAGAFMLMLTILASRIRRQRPVSGMEGLISDIGEVRVRIAPRGKVWVQGEYWNAESDQVIEVGEKVEVVDVVQLTLRVRKVEG
jgi:membrane-bound serine protease (ClpP class)